MMRDGINQLEFKIMKKSIVMIATLAALSIVACQKEKEDLNEPVKGELTEITAKAGETVTKAYVDGLQVKWSASDVIAVADDSDNPVSFTLASGENTASGTFSGNLGGASLGNYAVYPYGPSTVFVINDAYVDYLSTWEYGKSEVPMYGINDGTGTYTFYNIGGAIQVTYSNIPTTTNTKSFVITETHTGGEAKYITGSVNIHDLDSTPSFDFSSLDGQVVTISDIPNDATDVTLVIPVPSGTGYNFRIELFETGEASPILGSVKTATNRTITANRILRFPTIKVNAAKGDVLWNENFVGCDDGSQPTSSTATVFNGGRATYNYGGATYTKIYTSALLGDAPELLIAKSTRSETWVVSNIPTGSWDELTLTYKANQNISITSSDVTVGDSTELDGTYTRTISDASGLTSFSLTFSMTTDSNARIDDILLIAGAPEPGITVATSTATSTGSATGTTATLNGSLTLINGASNANVTEAGFYYKISASGDDYTKVICASAPTSTTLFSYDVTGLTKDAEYTYYAYAVYDSGSEITGKATEKTFTPILSSKKTYTLVLTDSDFLATSYAANDGDHVFTAIATDSSTMEVTINTSNVMKSSGIQFKASGQGVMYNKTNLGSITSITTVETSGKSNVNTKNIGTEENPSTNSGSGGYFKLSKTGSGAANLASITIVFER